MTLRRVAMLFAGMVLAVTVAQAQTSARVRGTIVAVAGDVLSVKSREGQNLDITLADNLTVSVVKAIRFDEFKQGDKVGATTLPGPSGMPVAIEVHYLPPGVPEGQGPWDLQPGSTMTNASVAAMITGTGTRELTLQFKDKSETILVPDSAALARTVAGSRADLMVGESVFTVAQTAGDGKLSAARIMVGKDGVKPPL